MLFWCSDNIWLSHANFLEIFSVLSFQRYWKHKNIIWMLNFSEISVKSRFIMRWNLKRKISMYIRACQRKKPKQSHPEKILWWAVITASRGLSVLTYACKACFFRFFLFHFQGINLAVRTHAPKNIWFNMYSCFSWKIIRFFQKNFPLITQVQLSIDVTELFLTNFLPTWLPLYCFLYEQSQE